MRFVFSWDDSKAQSNLRKHGVSFAEASTVFDDVLAVTYADDVHSNSEQRYLTFGQSSNLRILVISHTENDGGIRIISSRKADRAERRIYEQG
jgi:uncharacterized protein